MARLQVQVPSTTPAEFRLSAGCNRVGREGENEILIPHHSVSRQHCEIWLTDDAVLIRDLTSRNGTFIDGEQVAEAQWSEGQTLRLGDVEILLIEGPVRISVPDLHLPAQRKEQLFMPDGAPCCYVHDGVAAVLTCTKCARTFCGQCVRELRVAGGMPRSFCPECNGACERIAPLAQQARRASWLDKLKDAFTKPPSRGV